MKLMSARLLGRIGAFLVKAIRITLRVQMIRHPHFSPDKPSIYAFWHGDLLVPILYTRRIIKHRVSGFVSTSKDGDILATVLEKLNYDVVRGSTSNRAIGGMVKLLRDARAGSSLGIAPDGPRGPSREVSQGLIFLAQKSKLPVIPIGLHLNRYKQFEKSWDKFKLPGLFSKAILYFDEPVYISDTNADAQQLLAQKLDNATLIAQHWGSGDKQKIDQVELIEKFS